MLSEKAWKIFNESIEKYHEEDRVDQSFHNPYPEGELSNLLYRKNWIDTVQWHYEDLIRDPEIDPNSALELKRKIDASNQDRTDLVEEIDDYFYEKYHSVQKLKNATFNTESPAWAIDRFSILALKIYHMEEEVMRKDATPEHHLKCREKLAVLRQQHEDLATAIDQLIEDIAAGRKYMRVYKQMKMYNDDELNPVLRAKR